MGFCLVGAQYNNMNNNNNKNIVESSSVIDISIKVKKSCSKHIRLFVTCKCTKWLGLVLFRILGLDSRALLSEDVSYVLLKNKSLLLGDNA